MLIPSASWRTASGSKSKNAVAKSIPAAKLTKYAVTFSDSKRFRTKRTAPDNATALTNKLAIIMEANVFIITGIAAH